MSYAYDIVTVWRDKAGWRSTVWFKYKGKFYAFSSISSATCFEEIGEKEFVKRFAGMNNAGLGFNYISSEPMYNNQLTYTGRKYYVKVR